MAARDADFMQVAELYRGRQDFDIGRLVAELVAGRERAAAARAAVQAQRPRTSGRRGNGRGSCSGRKTPSTPARSCRPTDPNYLTEEQARAEKRSQVGDIPVPPKYTSADFLPGPFWRLRGKLDVPKERWVSFPHCEGEDGTLVIAWAGLDHLQLARAVSGYCRVQEKGGSTDPGWCHCWAASWSWCPG